MKEQAAASSTEEKTIFVLQTGGWGGGGGTRDFKWRGWSKDFFGFEIFDSGIFLGTKIWQVFFWVAWFE